MVAVAWIALLILRLYGGNPTGIFYTGREIPLPPSLTAVENVRRAPDPKGYDGQFYHLIAHAPLSPETWQPYVDNARLRWRRIGLPAAASVISTLTRADLHLVWIALELASVFLAAYWLAPYGLAVLTIPAVLVSLDRGTVDIALIPCVIGLIRFSGRRAVHPILIAAPLIRETGILLIAGYALWNAIHRNWPRAATSALCALPAIAWWTWVQTHTPPDATQWLAAWPFAGLIRSTLTLPVGPKLAITTELLATAGIWTAFVCALLALRRTPTGLPELTCAAFVVFFSLFGRADIWDTAYAAGRTLSPLLTLLLMLAIRDRRAFYVTPILLILPRILLQYGAELALAIRGAY